MSSANNKRTVSLRRLRFFNRVTNGIKKALSPAMLDEIIEFNAKKGVSTWETVFNREGKLRYQRSKNPGFIASLYMGLPQNTRRRFLLLTSGEREPNAREYKKLERELLGRARQRLMRELLPKIKALPHLRGQKFSLTKEERRGIRQRVEEEKRRGNSKRQAVKIIAKSLDYTERHVWRIISYV